MVRLVSIPDRDFGYWFTARGHQPINSVAEISIPDRDFRWIEDRKATLNLPAYFELTPTWRKLVNKFRVYYCLPKLYLITAVLPSKQWHQPLSTETEIRWTAFVPFSDASMPFLSEKSQFTKNEWRFRYMGNYEQLELFDLRAYTSEQPTASDGEEKPFEEIQQSIDCEQLELDLFPQQPYKTPRELMRLAA